VDSAELDALEQRIKAINVTAEVQRTQRSQVCACVYVRAG